MLQQHQVALMLNYLARKGLVSPMLNGENSVVREYLNQMALQPTGTPDQGVAEFLEKLGLSATDWKELQTDPEYAELLKQLGPAEAIDPQEALVENLHDLFQKNDELIEVFQQAREGELATEGALAAKEKLFQSLESLSTSLPATGEWEFAIEHLLSTFDPTDDIDIGDLLSIFG